MSDQHHTPPQSQDEPVDPDKKLRRSWVDWFTGSPTLIISILLHLLFALFATIFVVQRIEEKRKQNFTEVSVATKTPAAAAAAAQQQTRVSQSKSSQSIPDVTHSITVADVSSVSLPEVALPSDSAPSGDGRMEGTAVSGLGVDTAVAVGSIDAAALATQAFGKADPNRNGLVGEFFDLKQTPGRKPSEVDNDSSDRSQFKYKEYYRAVAKFVNDNWNEADLRTYYKANKELYLTRLIIPVMPSEKAATSFGVQDEVRSWMWTVLYKGNFRVPTSGRYRFVGQADNFMCARVKGRTVLMATWNKDYKATDAQNSSIRGIKPEISNTGGYPYALNPGHPDHTITFTCGEWMSLQAGETIPIQILIGDDGGNTFFYLLVEEDGHTYDKTADGSPILPPFKLNQDKDPVLPGEQPPTSPQPLGWTLEASEDPAQ